MEKSDWQNSVFLKSIDAVKELKNSDGLDLQVYGSSKLIETLIKHDLVDELWLKTFPILLGTGKRLFGEIDVPIAYTLIDSYVTPKGVIFANYKRDGKLVTGTVGV